MRRGRPGRATRRTSAPAARRPAGREDAAWWPGHGRNNPDTNPTSDRDGRPAPRGSQLTGAQANDQYVAKHFPFPWFHSLTGSPTDGHDPGADQAGPGWHRLRREPHREPRQSRRRSLPRPAEGVDDSGLQLDHAEQLQRRPRRDLQGQQPVRFVHATGRPIYHAGPATPGVDRAEELHRWPVRLRPVPAVLHPDDREVGRLQGRRPDRHHVRRGQPAVHLLRQQLQQRERLRPDLGRPAELRQLDRGRCRGRDHLRQDVAHRADRPELDARHQLAGRPALPRSR